MDRYKNMKLIVTTPIVFISVMILNSCGSGPNQEDIEKTRVVNENTKPPTLEPVNYNQMAIPVSPGIPVATLVAGRPGYVFNPYNQNMVEVSGLISGTKVRDPLDPNPNNIFLIP